MTPWTRMTRRERVTLAVTLAVYAAILATALVAL